MHTPSNYPDGMSHTVEQCTGYVTCCYCGREFPVQGTYEFGAFTPSDNAPGYCMDCERWGTRERWANGTIRNKLMGWITGAADELAGDIIDVEEAECREVQEGKLIVQILEAVAHCMGSDNDATTIIRSDLRTYVKTMEQRVLMDLREV